MYIVQVNNVILFTVESLILGQMVALLLESVSWGNEQGVGLKRMLNLKRKLVDFKGDEFCCCTKEV